MKTLKTTIFLLSLTFFLYFLITGGNAYAQHEKQTAMNKISAIEKDFTDKIKAMDYKPSLPVPPIIMDNPRSFGNYDDTTNIIHTCNWATLPPEQRGFFSDFAKKAGHGMTAKRFFELSVYQWIFIHELGHWWRKCQHQKADPYEEEKDANRIAAAYWNQLDKSFYQFMVGVFTGAVQNIPNPVPAGISKEKYLKDNYNKLPGGQSYTWYQSIMNVEISKEKPFETFRQAIEFAGKPLAAKK